MKKVALCIRGAVAKARLLFCEPGQLYAPGAYVNVTACFRSIKRHILDANPNCEFDTYIHCWNIDLQDTLCKLYQPKISMFENNITYAEEINKKTRGPREFGGVSQALSIKKSIEMMDGIYDTIILYRPDVLLWKDMDLTKYNPNKIYVNGHVNANGDFHFVMNCCAAERFKNLYDSVELGNNHETHFWIKNYVNNYMHEDLIMDDIIPGKHQEVLRKVYQLSYLGWQVPLTIFSEYGLSLEDLHSY